MPTWRKHQAAPPQSEGEFFCTQNSPFVLFKRGEEKVAQCGGTEVRCGRGVRQTVGALLSVRLEDGERCSDCLLGSGAALPSGLRAKPLPRKRRMQ